MKLTTTRRAKGAKGSLNFQVNLKVSSDFYINGPNIIKSHPVSLYTEAPHIFQQFKSLKVSIDILLLASYPAFTDYRTLLSKLFVLFRYNVVRVT